ncbi:MAG: GDP-mannose dehydrogenase, partial [Limisphaerales bacterium]
MVKYACNAFHAAKITFANEVGRVGKSVEVDARAVMSLLCQDTRLNISSYYM